jgi:very-short-patch-repair endonuclease
VVLAAGLAELGTAHRGVWTRSEALAVTTRGRVDGHLRRGEWRTVWPGVFTDAGTTLDHGQRARAAVLACGPGAVAVARTAARLHGLPLIDDRDPTTRAQEHLLDDVATSGARRPLRRCQQDGTVRVLRRTALTLLPEDVVRTSGGLLLTTPLQTLVDLAALLSFEALACAVDHALHTRLVDETQLVTAVRERTWCPGVVHLRTAVARADRRAESPAETLARLALLPTMPGFVPQHRLLGPDGRVLARYDLADEGLRLAVEVEGKAGHAGPQMVARDRRRDRVSELHGWRTERVTWWELRRQPASFVSRIAEVAQERRRLLLP